LIDIDSIAEGVEGALTSSSTMRVTHMLYADDLSLTANRPDQLQTMRDCLDEYAKRKGLIINIAESEVVHFKLHSFNVPAFSVGGALLANKLSYKNLCLVFYRTHILPNLPNICWSFYSWLSQNKAICARAPFD